MLEDSAGVGGVGCVGWVGGLGIGVLGCTNPEYSTHGSKNPGPKESLKHFMNRCFNLVQFLFCLAPDASTPLYYMHFNMSGNHINHHCFGYMGSPKV